MADDGPRRLPPQPTAVQASIPQPVVPEVTLLWEGEESVYWKPTTPGSKTASAQLRQPAHSRQPQSIILPHAVQTSTVSVTVSQMSTTAKAAAGNCTALVSHPGRGTSNVDKGVHQSGNTVGQLTGSVSLPSNKHEYSADVRPPGPSLHQRPTTFQHPSTASITDSTSKYTARNTTSVSQVSNAIARQNKGLPEDGVHPTVGPMLSSNMPTGRQYEREYHAGQQYREAYSSSNVHRQHNLEFFTRNNATVSQGDAQVSNNSTVASGVLFSKKEAVSIVQPPVYDKDYNSGNFTPEAVVLERKQEFLHGTQKKTHDDHSKNPGPSEAEVLSQKMGYGLTSEMQHHYANEASVPLHCGSQQQMEYNPLLYSSEKKPFQETNTNWYRNGDKTPVAARESRAIVPRAVNFDSVTPVEWRNRLVANKENWSPELSYKSTPDNGSQEQPQDSDKQVTPYRHLSSQSPMIVSTPDPFLQKIIEGKDQQIFQLHKVLETILSKNDSKDRISSQSSSFSASPRSIVHREVSTQTIEHCQNYVASRDVGVNTEFSWPELLESLDQNRKNGGPSTILKNSSSVKSVVMQKSSNTSSVRFDTDSDRVIDPQCASTAREQVQNRAISYQDGRPALQAARLEKESRHSGDSQLKGMSLAHSRDARNKTAKNVDERGDHNLGEPGKCPQERCEQRGRNGGVFSGNNHREVSLTLREVVLTTIEEDPGSPQASLHLNLSDYPGDTILPQTHRIESTSARPGAASAPTVSRQPEEGRLRPTRLHRDMEMTPRCEGDRDRHHHHRPGTPVASRRKSTEADEGSGTSTGVTIYRNVMNNIEQLLDRDRFREEEDEREEKKRMNGRTRGQDNAHLTSLEQQLQQFGLSFLEPRALQSRNTQSSNPGLGPSAGSLLSMYRANTIGHPPSAELNAHTSAPREFSVATEEFLRKNGLMEP
ncbi:hypothetical protein FHG87_000896 [Trinorchestia longiramus]|nr:hypothetical protein FHG87_000896 [Trinorchestia longiramus]